MGRQKPETKGQEPENKEPLMVTATGVNDAPKKSRAELSTIATNKNTRVNKLKAAVTIAIEESKSIEQKERLQGVIKCLNAIRNAPNNNPNKEASIKKKFDIARANLLAASESSWDKANIQQVLVAMDYAKQALIEHENSKPELAKSEPIFPDDVGGINSKATNLNDAYDGIKDAKPLKLGLTNARIQGDSLIFDQYQPNSMSKQAANTVINMGKHKDGPIVVTGTATFQHDLLEKCFEQGMSTPVVSNFKLDNFKFSTKSIPLKRDAKAYAALINSTPSGDAADFGTGQEGTIKRDAQTILNVMDAHGDGTTTNKAIEKMAEKRYKNDPEGAAKLVSQLSEKIQANVAKHMRKGLEASGMQPEKLKQFDDAVSNKGPDEPRARASAGKSGGR